MLINSINTLSYPAASTFALQPTDNGLNAVCIIELKSTFAILKEYGSDSAKTLKVSLYDLKLTISDLLESKQEIETQSSNK